MAKALDKYDAPHLTTAQLEDQVQIIQAVMRSVMTEGEHYGIIPGTRDKRPTLLKSGAEKLMFTFRFNSDVDVQVVDLPDEHREYRIKVLLYNADGLRLGAGVGSCSTMEGKYRYRWDNTGKPVPREYWDNGKDASLLGGSSYVARKVGNDWLIFRRVEGDNPADYYNTALKMAKKRALVDAVLTVTAASDIFTQDLEEEPVADLRRDDDYQGAPETTAKTAKNTSNGKNSGKPETKTPQRRSDNTPASAAQVKMLKAKLREAGGDEAALCRYLKVEGLDRLPKGRVDEAIDAIGGGKAAINAEPTGNTPAGLCPDCGYPEHSCHCPVAREVAHG